MAQHQLMRAIVLAVLMISTGSGCVTFTQHAIPANRLPTQFAAPSKSALMPINFSVLAGNHPKEHFLDSGDVVAITVQGVIPQDSKELPPIIQSTQTTLARIYYPANGLNLGPGIGLPLEVQSNGYILLPLTDPVPARGLTLIELAEKIRLAYLKKEIVKEGNDQVNVSLIRSRVNRILVLREDIATPDFVPIQKGTAVYHKRGSAEVVDLPIYESDVLHALATSGGLPGTDAHNEIWILRKSTLEQHAVVQIQEQVAGGQAPDEVIKQMPAHLEAIRIPLKLCPDQPIPFTPEDVMLQDGDVVYIEPRREEYFYTGGLLPGGQIPMPRDEDLDILEAIALANGSVGGLGGTSSTVSLRAGAGVGNIIPPTRVLVLRKLPNGEQLPIRLDLAKAMKDPRERIQVLSGDYIMMYYRPGEMFVNSTLNFFNINLSVAAIK